MRAVVTAFVLSASGAATAETLHYSLSGGAGLAHGLAGLKFEVRYGPGAAFAGLGLGWGSSRPAAGIRYYFVNRESGAGFVSVEYAYYNESWRDRICCEYFDDTYHNFGAIIGYRVRFAPGFFELGMGPAWTLFHSKGYGPINGPYENKRVTFGWMNQSGVPNFTLALGLEY